MEPMSRLATVITSTGRTPPKIIAYALHGVGKTTLAAGAKALVIDCEMGAGNIPGLARTPYIETWTEMRGWLEDIKRDGLPPECKALAIDTLDWMVQRIVEYVCIDLDKKSAGDVTNTLGSAHDGFFKAREIVANVVHRQLLPLLNGINARGIPILMLAHAANQKMKSPEGYDMRVANPDLPEFVLPIFLEWADAILYGSIAQDGSRVMQTQMTGSVTAKNRYSMPPLIAMDWGTIVAGVRGMLTPVAQAPTPVAAPVMEAKSAETGTQFETNHELNHLEDRVARSA
jgi:hypothetical protein